MHIRPMRAFGNMLGQTPGFVDCYTNDGQPGFYEGEVCRPWTVDPPPPAPAGPGPQPPPPPPLGPGGQPLPPGFVAPGPTELHAERWDLDECLYTIAYGDTYVGIAKTYLDPSGVRWREIWNLNRDQHPNPDAIYPDQVINMGDEACENMKRWTNRGGPDVNPSEIGPDTVGDKARKWWPWILGAGVIGGGLYWMR